MLIRLLLLFFALQAPLLAYSKIPEKVLICGVCRNVESRLPYTIKIMEDIGSLFDDYKVIVYENNSTDQTVHILYEWMQTNSNVFVECEWLDEGQLAGLIVNLNRDGTFFRPEEIARARNIVLDHAMSDLYKDYSYVIWMDMDFKIAPLLEGILDTFHSSKDWDAVFAYGIDTPGTYWDWYAFRDAVYPLGSELLGNDWWYMPKNFHLNPGDDWYPVYSAFGGCGIYKKSSIKGCRYSGLVTDDLEKVAKRLISIGMEESNPQVIKYVSYKETFQRLVSIPFPSPDLPKVEDPKIGFVLNAQDDALVWTMSTFVFQYPSVCEHVPFHARMILNGHGKLYINPKLIFTYGG